MGDHAVAGRPDVRQAGGHRLVDDDGASGAELCAGLDEQVGVGADPDDDQHQVDVPAERLTVWSGPSTCSRAVAVGAAADAGDGGAGVDLDAVAFEFGVHQGAEFGVDGGQHLGEHLDLGDRDAAGGEAFGHLQADVAGADDERGRGLDPVDAGGQGEGVAHRVQQVHAVVGAEGVQAVDRRPDRHGAGADDQLVVVDDRFAAVGARTARRCPATSIEVARVSSRSFMPVASRSAWVRWARLRQWVTSPET